MARIHLPTTQRMPARTRRLRRVGHVHPRRASPPHEPTMAPPFQAARASAAARGCAGRSRAHTLEGAI
eukprot:9495279-Pyramimonas_sp.AAC.1